METTERHTMSDEYPYEEGTTIVLGPEIFASLDEETVCWKGRNYVPQASNRSVRRAAREVVDQDRSSPEGECEFEAALHRLWLVLEGKRERIELPEPHRSNYGDINLNGHNEPTAP